MMILKYAASNKLVKTLMPGCIRIHRCYSDGQQNLRNVFELYQRNPAWVGRSRYLPAPVVSSAENIAQHLEIESKKIWCNAVSVEPEKSEWTPDSKRVGAIGVKLGTSCMWTKEGRLRNVSLIQIRDCIVLDTQLSGKDGGNDEITQLIVGAIDEDDNGLKSMTRDRFEWYADRGIFPKKKWTGFKCTKNALLMPGTPITAAHFMPGQRVRVKGVTIDHGFQGVMKRWGMKGQPRTHGQTKTHRKMGATGGGGDPGRIFPGKKMAGQMGGHYATTPPMKVLRINLKFNVLYVHGCVPGEVGGFLKIMDFYNIFPNAPPPFPTAYSDATNLSDDLYDDEMFCSSDASVDFGQEKL